MNTTPTPDELRELVFGLIRQWLDRGELQPLGSATGRPGYEPVAAPGRLSVGLADLDAIARAAGFPGGLAEAFEEVELGPESDPLMH